jgi:hypothetical protein
MGCRETVEWLPQHRDTAAGVANDDSLASLPLPLHYYERNG